MTDLVSTLEWIRKRFHPQTPHVEEHEGYGLLYRDDDGEVHQLDTVIPREHDPVPFTSSRAFRSHVAGEAPRRDEGENLQVIIHDRRSMALVTVHDDHLQVHATATATRETATSGAPLSLEEAAIYLQTSFEPTAERDQLTSLLSRVDDGTILTAEDNGIAQRVTVKTGAALREMEDIPNPAILKPYRGFPELDNLEARFAVRLHSVKDSLPRVSFHELVDPRHDHEHRAQLAAYMTADSPVPVAW
jgi:hypothetical protein